MDQDSFISKRQSKVSEEGKRWEEYVRKYIEGILPKISKDLVVISQSEIEKNTAKKDEDLENLRHFLSIEVFYNNRFLKILGDNDLIIYSKTLKRPIVIISCKLSLHGRLTESLFYALYFRIFRKIRYILITPDKGRQSNSNKWKSEWGTPSKPTKDRLLANLFLDGVYVENNIEFMPKSFNSSETTKFGDIIKPLYEIEYDIKNWYNEIAKTYWFLKTYILSKRGEKDYIPTRINQKMSH